MGAFHVTSLLGAWWWDMGTDGWSRGGWRLLPAPVLAGVIALG